MTYDPSQPIPLLVEIQINGVWVTITSRSRAAGGVNITVGKSQNAGQGESSRMTCTIGNPDGFLTEDNPLSPWYPYIGRGCPIRLSIVGVAPSPAVRFFGAIDTMTAVNPGGADATMQVTAVGTIGQSIKGKAFKSALTRSMTGVSPSGIQPYQSWSLEDDSSSSVFASDLPDGSRIQPVGDVSFAANSSLLGSKPLPTFGNAAFVQATIPAYMDTHQWVVQFLLFVPAEPAVETIYADVHTQGTDSSPLIRISVEPGFPSKVHAKRYDNTGVLVLDVSSTLDGSLNWPTEAQFFGQWAMITVAQTAGGGSYQTYLAVGANAVPGNTTSTGIAGTASRVSYVKFFGYTNPPGFGHLNVYTDPAFVIGTDDENNVLAMNGWDGEFTADRLFRVGREEGIATSGGTTGAQRMGPQTNGTVMDVLYEIEAVDQGVLHDQSPTGGIVLAGVQAMCNRAADLAITTDALEPDPGAAWDFQNIANDITSSRPGGSSAHLSDEVNVAKLRTRLTQTPTVNVHTDDQLTLDAGWRLNVGTAGGPRLPALGMNMRNVNAARYATQVLGILPGSRLTAAPGAVPSQYPPGGLDLLVIGWTEVLDGPTWLWRPACVPYAPYNVAVYGTARYDSGTSTLTAAQTASQTSLPVATSDETVWATSGATPFDIRVAGERMTATAITSVASDGFGRTVSSGWGTADVGGLWGISGGNSSDYSVASGVANHAHQTANTPHYSTLLSGMTDVDCAVSFRTPAGVLPTGASIRVALMAHFGSTNNNYQFLARLETDLSVTAILLRRSGGSESSVLSATVPGLTWASGSFHRLRARIAGNVLSMKIWHATDIEPAWLITAADGLAPIVGGQVGVTSMLNTGNTNTSPVVINFEDFEVTNPQTFAVTRAVNGVVKPQTAGTPIALWNTPRYGH